MEITIFVMKTRYFLSGTNRRLDKYFFSFDLD